MDVIRLSYYPFLPGVRDAIMELGPTVPDLLTSSLYSGSRARAEERVSAAMGDAVLESKSVIDESAALDELLASALTKMLIVCLGDRILAGRYAGKESARVRRALRSGPLEDVEFAVETLHLPINDQRIHFSDYLGLAPSDKDWKMVLRSVQGGFIVLERSDLEGLVEESLRRKMQTELEGEMKTPAPTDLRNALEPYLTRLGVELNSAKENWNTGDFGPVRDSAFPPCILQLFDDMKAGAMIPHHGRFAFASFLGTVGMSADQVLDYMQAIPNFSREKSEYQIRHITGELSVDAYTPPGCGTMQTNGVCPLARRDNLCHSIKHPLSYYRAKLRSMAPAIKDESAPKPAPTEAA
jgi:DNA primase large subunit